MTQSQPLLTFPASAPPAVLEGHYQFELVVVSLVVAVLASYTALTLVGRLRQSHGLAARLWALGGGFAMGSGVWAMHFIGMLAFKLPIPLGYDLEITVVSWMLPVGVSTGALWQLRHPVISTRRLGWSALLLGCGINLMHYSGMLALRMDPPIFFTPSLFALSILIAIVASAGGLWVALKLRPEMPYGWLASALAALILGGAIAGMHYTGMAAANFPVGSICRAATGQFNLNHLALLVAVAVVSFMAVAVMASIYEGRLEMHSRLTEATIAIAHEREELYRNEQEARVEAERVSDMKDEFLATLSHELRTPLNAILGWAQILMHGPRDDATLRRGLQTIERNARAQASLIEDLLDMSKIVSGKVQLETERIWPASFIHAAVETVRPAALAKQITLDTRLDSTAGPVLGDGNRMQQVMWNLLANAVKFTPNGGHVSVDLSRDGSNVRIAVRDTGIGIAPDFLPHVFDRFRQADSSSTRRHAGLGLGLSIAEQLVELHGGTIEAESEGENRGSAFIVRLPLQADMPQRSPAGPPRPRQDFLQSGGIQPAVLNGVSILVVDDEPDSLAVVEQVLATAGARVSTARSAPEALAMLEHRLPDLLVSDIAMPDIDGLEMVRRIRAHADERIAALPAIALSAYARENDRVQAKRAGFNDYLVKPLQPAAFLQAVAALVRPKAERL
ncbi:response regulator [Massilia arenosa]|uniref:Virulence sensor protein BvgS n=1 Tax=Zemynaea arenosa TaxID=2561931 RepID=A0A4Y9SGU4_9BURK|nr:MHYT domain-containing protein [Massilia arenosa]TFW19497.1 response regulator [Massilia arenosa]